MSIAAASPSQVPDIIWCVPFALLLLAIAFLPLWHRTHSWWEQNRNKLILSLILSSCTLLYYALRGYELGGSPAAGAAPALSALSHALHEYIPFIILLFSLYTICGSLNLSGDLRATPLVNCAFLATGAILANLIGTTGASMLLIAPLLETNAERKFKVHTVCFFILLVSNIGGSLTALGDPPLFLGYLRGVPFLWTFENLWHGWILSVAALLAAYYVWDLAAYLHEERKDIAADEATIRRLRLRGKRNIPLLIAVVAVLAFVDPMRPLPGTDWKPFFMLRESLLLLLTAVSFFATPRGYRAANRFSFGPILEVAAVFIGIFVTMQVPLEILRSEGPSLGLSTPNHFFWITGLLSSFLDNAPTYAVFFETAGTLPASGGEVLHGLSTATGSISSALLRAISFGAVFMGANTYIGNGPNFMVKTIAESRGVKMPSFFGFLFRYSMPVLLPVYLVISFFFL